MELIETFTEQHNNSIRVRGTNENPIFCAKDVCDALGIVNHRHKVATLDEDEKLTSLEATAGQRRNMVFVTEPGLYKLILTCREVNIKGTVSHAFGRWVFHTVLPSIRKRGKYELEQKLEAIRKQCVQYRDLNVWSVVLQIVGKTGVSKKENRTLWYALVDLCKILERNDLAEWRHKNLKTRKGKKACYFKNEECLREAQHYIDTLVRPHVGLT